MHFFTKAAVLFLATLAIADDRCTNGPFVKDPPQAGRKVPNPACHTQWDNGEVIVGVEAWAAKWQMRAIRFKYSQMGWGEIHGNIKDHDGTHAVAEWKASEEVNIRTWNNKPDDGDPVDAVGRILITTKGRTLLDIGTDPKKTAKNENYGSNMGGGIILGARTASGVWLDYVEFNMLKSKVKSAELIDVKMSKSLEDMNKKQEGIDSMDLTTMYFINENPKNGSNMIYSQTLKQEKATEKTIETSTENEWSAEVSVTVGASVGIPLISASVETTASTGFRNTQFESEKLSEKGVKKFEWTFECDPETPLPPQRAAKCVAKTTAGDFEGSFVGTVEVELVDGSRYKYKEKGQVKTMSYLDASTSCKEIPLKDVPSGATIGKDIHNVKGGKRSIRRSRIFRE
ncbi:hypothetical protein DM02DRAFT_732094 [Periconia macrospinosa]|uniref:Jacalin-type lectin domain-containing protein n=1 Tax=Periconia macrospinosa TaxID=97972 RepID=A0A2V1DAH7_9PLEO|nr:hypothetical protein DM02DRAFT_732094 [Periconia macrospinosa]